MPILIAHRGNINGPAPEYENQPRYIVGALASSDNKIHCEIDVWLVNGQLYLGHDNPTYGVNENFLINARLWCHAKNLEALHAMLQNPLIHCFWHEQDAHTITSRGYIWSYPNQTLTPKSVCVMPELYTSKPDLSFCAGICSDNLEQYLR